MADFSVYPPKVNSDDWNQLIDHGLTKPYAYLCIEESSGVWVALDGRFGTRRIGGSTSAGGVSGTAIASVFGTAMANLTSGRTYQESIYVRGDV